MTGVIYITTGASDVFAVRVETGDILWRYEAKLDSHACGSAVAG